jgi:eukaryotic-like serine/threonine-protein kinase
VIPNQGVRRSARSALLSGLAAGLAGGLVVGLIFGPAAGPPGVVFGLVCGLLFGLIAALAFGGYAYLSHLALRLVLWRHRAMPLNYVSFLDYCTERIFLRKVGGGYIFVHRLLLEYFASLEPDETVKTSD